MKRNRSKGYPGIDDYQTGTASWSAGPGEATEAGCDAKCRTLGRERCGRPLGDGMICLWGPGSEEKKRTEKLGVQAQSDAQCTMRQERRTRGSPATLSKRRARKKGGGGGTKRSLGKRIARERVRRRAAPGGLMTFARRLLGPQECRAQPANGPPAGVQDLAKSGPQKSSAVRWKDMGDGAAQAQAHHHPRAREELGSQGRQTHTHTHTHPPHAHAKAPPQPRVLRQPAFVLASAVNRRPR
jgi:hypothetical protein